MTAEIHSDKYVDPDGVWLTEPEAYQKYGHKTPGQPQEEWAASHSLQPLPACPGAGITNSDQTQQTANAPSCTGSVQPRPPKKRNRCGTNTRAIVRTPELNGVQNIDRGQFPGIDDYHPWHKMRIAEWKIEAGIRWKKTGSGYKNGTDAGIPSENVALTMPDAAESADWSQAQWAEWNENRQAADLRRVQIYERKCDGTLLTEFQAHRMFGTPFDPKDFPETFMQSHDRWKTLGYWIMPFRRDDMVIMNTALGRVTRAGLPLTAENVAAEIAPFLFERWRWTVPDEEARREKSESTALGMARGAQKPETYDMDLNPETPSLTIAGPWLDMGIDMRRMGHKKTRIHMSQAISRVERAGLDMTMVNFVNDYVNFHYSDADIGPMNDFAIKAFNDTWNKYEAVWPTNTESNPWAHLSE